MTDEPGYELRGAVGIVRFGRPPLNTLSHPMRSGLAELLGHALADDAAKAVVVTGIGRAFCAGAEITEFNTPRIGESPTAHAIWALIESARKPVVAAIHGLAMGGGLEFAQACHYRVAAPDARLAQPEVRLGLIPGAVGGGRSRSRGSASSVSAKRKAASTTSVSATRWTSAVPAMAAASTGSPQTIMSSAFATPTARGRRCVPPAPGMRPSRTSGWARRASGAATR